MEFMSMSVVKFNSLSINYKRGLNTAVNNCVNRNNAEKTQILKT